MKKMIIAQKGIGVFLVFLMLWAVLVPTQFSNMAYAQELQSSVITGASITDLSNQPITNPIGAWRPFRIHANYVLPNNKVHTGDTTTMILPVGFAAAQPFTFEVKAGSDLVANGQIIDGNPVKIVLTYTDYVETHSNVQGSFYFNTQINSNTQLNTGVIPVTLTVQGDNAVVDAGTVTFNPPQVTPVPLIKAGWMDSTNKTIGHYKINVNQANKAMVGAVLVDTLSNPGVEYVDGSFQVFEGVWVSNPTGTDIIFTESKDITSEFANKISVQGNRFTVAIGSRPAGKGLQFRYKVKINYNPVVGEVFNNEAELEDNGQTHKHATSYKIMYAGGTGEGYVYKIQIKKKAEGSGAPLSGATFKVIRVSNNETVGTITTGADGSGEIGNLLKDDYQLVEIKAPNGYQPLTAPIEVKVNEFTANQVAFKEIENKPNTQNKVEVTVTKQWEGVVGNHPNIKLQLLKNGQEEGAPVELINGTTTYTWTNLDEKDNEGNPYDYKVKEVGENKGYVQLENNWYKVIYDGYMQGGFTVINKKLDSWTPLQPPIRDIAVTKVWRNDTQVAVVPPVNSVTVELYKDGVATGKTKQLSGQNKWTAIFTDLPVSATLGGENYKYTIKEVGENGGKIEFFGKWYKVIYSGDMADGFEVTNKETTTPEKPDKPDKPNKPNGPTPPGGTTPSNGPTPPSGTTPSNGPTPPSATTPPDNPTQLENSTQTDKATKLNHSSKENKTTLLKKVAQSGRRLPKTGDGANPAVYALALFALGSLLTVVGYRRRKNVN